MFLLIVLSSIAITAKAEAAIEQKPNDQKSNYVLCRNQKTVRTIRVDNDDTEKQCVTTYTKSGVDKEVGRAQSLNNCTRIMGNIKENLEKAHWKCKDMGNVSITTSADDN